MTAKTVERASIKQLEAMGFSTTWGYSAYEVCVRYKGNWIGTWKTARLYAFPRQQADDIAHYCNEIDLSAKGE